MRFAFFSIFPSQRQVQACSLPFSPALLSSSPGRKLKRGVGGNPILSAQKSPLLTCPLFFPIASGGISFFPFVVRPASISSHFPSSSHSLLSLLSPLADFCLLLRDGLPPCLSDSPPLDEPSFRRLVFHVFSPLTSSYMTFQEYLRGVALSAGMSEILGGLPGTPS